MKEEIRVVADFDKARVKPVLFERVGRRYEVTAVNLAYERREGSGRWRYFSVTAEGNSYVLALDPEHLTWWLVEVLEG